MPVETADRFVLALGRAGLRDVSYHRLARIDHCPYSLIRVPTLRPVVDAILPPHTDALGDGRSSKMRRRGSADGAASYKRPRDPAFVGAGSVRRSVGVAFPLAWID